MYVFEHNDMVKMNHFGHKRKIGKGWYAGAAVGPINDIIRKVVTYAYAHHIERLMYLSNFMLLNEFDPDDVYEWFMVFFIDSYQWVMEANVYAMGQYSTGSMLMTRPYVSSSNYVNKMSDYKTKKDVYEKIKLGSDEYEWFDIWDALYYNFINNNKKEFSKNYAMASSVAHWDKKTKSDRDEMLNISKKYLKAY
jgi:deoxyribodipyrimidine photolyase-related protein